MFIVSKALFISSATVIVRAGGAIWLNPFATVLFGCLDNVCLYTASLFTVLFVYTVCLFTVVYVYIMSYMSVYCLVCLYTLLCVYILPVLFRVCP